MSKLKWKVLLPYGIAVGITLSIVLMLITFPRMLWNHYSFSPLEFVVEEQIQDGDGLVLKGEFSNEIDIYENLWFYMENAKIELSIGDRIVHFNEKENVPSFFKSPGSAWGSFNLKEVEMDEPIEIRVSSFYGAHDQAAQKLLENMHMGDGIGLFKLMLSKINIFDMIIIITLIAGIIFLAEGAIDIFHGIIGEGIRISLFGFYCFTGGLWCITDVFYPYLTLLITPSWAAATIDMLGVVFFPMGIALLIRYYTRGTRMKKVMNLIAVLEIVLAGVCIFTQLFGFADLIEQQYFIGIVAYPTIGIAMLCIIVEMKKYKDVYLILLFFTILPVFISNLFNTVNLMYPFMPRRIVMQYSFAISALLLIFQLVSYAKSEVIKAETMRRLENEITNAQISIMMSQIQPHFLYNSLQGIKLLCDTNPSQAYEALDHFAYYLRGNLDSLNNTHLITFDKELVHIKDYLYLEQMRFGDKLNIDWKIGYTNFMIPPLTIQPMIENAVRHGVNKRKKGGTVTIKTEQTPETIIITIADNGVGFEVNKKLQDGRTHIGIENTRKRLESLCQAKLTIESQIGEGTVVKIILLKKNSNHTY